MYQSRVLYYLASGTAVLVYVFAVLVRDEVLHEGQRVGDTLQDAVHVAGVPEVSVWIIIFLIK